MKSSGSADKKRVIVDYKNVTSDILEMFTERYPYGYEDDIIRFKNAKGETVTAVPIETADTKYLIKVGVEMDKKIEAFLDEEEEDEDTVIPEEGGGDMEAPTDDDED